jgi:hypothetical protein
VTLSHAARLSAVALVTLALSACATMSVRSFQERGANLTQYRTFYWIPSAQRETGDPRLDNNRFFHERIQNDIEKQLVSRGFEMDSEGSPDLLVHYHASVTQKINPNGADQPSYVQCDDCEPYVYDAGSVVIDLVDFHTGKLVWRGWSDHVMDGAIDNQDWMEKTVDEAVGKILSQLPPRL